jgi:hypothetical protein
MTAMVTGESAKATWLTGESAKATWLTGVAGLLILGVAVVMMVVSAPSPGHPRPHPVAAQAYTPSMISESWSASSSERATPVYVRERSQHDGGKN